MARNIQFKKFMGIWHQLTIFTPAHVSLQGSRHNTTSPYKDLAGALPLVSHSLDLHLRFRLFNDDDDRKT